MLKILLLFQFLLDGEEKRWGISLCVTIVIFKHFFFSTEKSRDTGDLR